MAAKDAAPPEFAAKHRPNYMLMIVKKNPDSKTSSIVLVFRNWRSRWLRVECLCKRPRKDGTCWQTDRALEHMTDFGRSITKRIEHPRAGARS